VKDLGEVKYIVGIKEAWSDKGIYLCQRKYTLDLLEEMGMISYKP